MPVAPHKLIFLVTEDWYFHMHRLPQARAARDAGFDVCVATRVVAHGDKVAQEGFRVIPLKWKRGSLNPLAALRDIHEIRKMYRREKPSIVHHVSLKSVLLGTIAARATKVPVIVNAFTGLGLLFLGTTAKIKLLRLAVFPLLRAALHNSRVQVMTENHDDLKTLISLRMVEPAQAIVIRGSGVDVDHYAVLPEPAGPPVAACAARMLRGKGILVLAEAMQMLEGKSDLRLLLAGAPDPDTPDSLSEPEMNKVASQPNIEWLGRISNVRDLWSRVHIGVLPSVTGEGLPVSLMEAASCGRPLVTTDVAGCREIVENGVNGILVPSKDAAALADALLALANNPALRAEYGRNSRHMVETELSAQSVGSATVALYKRLMERT